MPRRRPTAPAFADDADLPGDGVPGEDPRPPSKSQRKRDMTALQDMGEALVAVRRDKLDKLEMPDTLRRAIYEAQRINSHEGKRRQLQYIGRLMRDADIAPIEAALAVWRGESGAEAARLHALEGWRNRLLAEGEATGALADFCRAYPAALNPGTLQALRNHIRMARREQAESRPPRHFREMFRLLREIVAGETDADAAEHGHDGDGHNDHHNRGDRGDTDYNDSDDDTGFDTPAPHPRGLT